MLGYALIALGIVAALAFFSLGDQPQTSETRHRGGMFFGSSLQEAESHVYQKWSMGIGGTVWGVIFCLLVEHVAIPKYPELVKWLYQQLQ